jgi:hypothetical protein
MKVYDMNEKQKNLIADYVIKMIDRSIKPQELEELNAVLSSDPEAARHYNRLMMMICNFQECGKEIIGDNKSANLVLKKEFWQAFAEDEKAAPAVEVVVPRDTDVMIQKVQYQKLDRKISRLPIITAMTSCAALLLIFGYVYLNPQPTEVATLVDSIGVKWEDAESSKQIGSRFWTAQRPIILKEGIIKVLYDNDVEVLLEAPVEFQFRSANEMFLRNGALFAKVSPAGKGFSVITLSAKIVDLGTEFGVFADNQSKTQLHVFKGKTTLASTKGKKVNNLGILGGQAREVDAMGGVKDIQLNKERFVRAIDSKTNVVWRKNSVDLADIVRAGNGLGTGNSTVRLDPIKGFTNDWHLETSAAKGFLGIHDSPFIDGIFIPDGDTPQIVSSRGDIFKECPDTNGMYYIDLFANPTPGILWANSINRTVEFNGQEYSDRGKSCIVMHGNHGITFDLDAIRKSHDCSIKRFVSRIGIADFEDNPCNADFYVLLDGQVQYSLRQYKQKGVLNDVSVKIEDTNRFLTLVTTDGEYPNKLDKDDSMSTFMYNWCMFTEPVLVLK